ncbi:unnamed protein product [marine sediment metagenome]|uniref:Uncharacterized protein n=1 Tax=marine sediment metagenome TaxID=412755 RepID=X0UE14_9ZZZZ
MENCTTIRQEKPCIFMKKTGCSFPCTTVVEQCDTCEHTFEVFDDMVAEIGKYCNVYARPFTKWYGEGCSMATHLQKEEEQEKKILDPRKAAKLRRKGG